MSLDGWKRASLGARVEPNRSPQRLLRMSHRQKHNIVAKRCQILRLTRHRRYAQGSAAGGGAL